MIDEATVYSELTVIFADVFERTDIVLRSDLTAKDVRGWDSFKQIEILIATESTFAFKFTSAEVDSMRSFGDLVAIVEARGRLVSRP